MSNIRVTYTGLVSFVIALITIVTGILFTVILTRMLTTEEFGTWGLITSLTLYVPMAGLVISFWSTRDISRGIDSGKTAVLGTVIMSIGAIIAYIIIANFMGYQTKSDQSALFFSSILIPIIFFNGILTAINLGWKPHTISYGTLSFSISQAILTFSFVYYMKLGLTGIILSTFCSYIVSITILLISARNKILGSFKITYLKKWLKIFWLPLYPSLSIIIDGLGIFVFSILTQSVVGLGFWTAALVVPNIISHVGLISRGVYPKLLEGGNRHYLQDNISQLFYFAFLMTGIVITFAKPALFALNPVYESSFIIVIVLALRNFFLLFTNMSIQNLSGIESVDTKNNTTFRDYIKSQLFYPHSLRLIQTITFIIILSIGLILLINSNAQDMDLLLFWSLASLLTQIPLSLYLFKLMTRKLEIKFPFLPVSKYFGIMILSFGISYLLYKNFLFLNENALEFIPNLLVFVLIGVMLYFTISFVMDSKIRSLTKSVFKEIIGGS